LYAQIILRGVGKEILSEKQIDKVSGLHEKRTPP